MRYLIKQGNMDVTYISGGLFVSNGRWTHPRAILEDYELVIVLKGRFYMEIGGEKREFQEGDCFLLFPGEEHCGVGAAWNVSFYWLHFRMQGEEVVDGDRRVQPLYKQMQEREFGLFIFHERCRPEEQTQLVVLANQLLYYQSLYKKTRETVRPCDIMMEMALYELARVTRNIQPKNVQAEKPEEETVMDKIYDYIRANCYKNLQIAEVARHFGYNPQYFIRMFRRKSGMSPKQYMIRQQIRQSKYLFATTSLKITEVAKQVGMSDARAFSKQFKKCEGISPREYRSAFQKTHYNSR